MIGVNTMKAMGMDGIAFALPIDDVKRVVQQLQAHGKVQRPYLGLKFVELDQTIASELRQRGQQGGVGAWRGGGARASNSPPDRGLYVMHVTPDSPAQRGGCCVWAIDTIRWDVSDGGLDRAAISTTKHSWSCTCARSRAPRA